MRWGWGGALQCTTAHGQDSAVLLLLGCFWHMLAACATLLAASSSITPHPTMCATPPAPPTGSDEELPAGVADDPFFQQEENPFDDPFFKARPAAPRCAVAECAKMRASARVLLSLLGLVLQSAAAAIFAATCATPAMHQPAPALLPTPCAAGRARCRCSRLGG